MATPSIRSISSNSSQIVTCLHFLVSKSQMCLREHSKPPAARAPIPRYVRIPHNSRTERCDILGRTSKEGAVEGELSNDHSWPVVETDSVRGYAMAWMKSFDADARVC